MAEPQTLAWNAMDALTRPVSEDAALAAAATVLEPIGLMNSFRAWWKSNGAHVMRRLNG